MPGRHWVIIKNLLSGDYKIIPWWDEIFYSKKESWMGKYYCAAEMRNPQWEEIGIYESEEDAQDALGKILQN